MLEFCDVVGLRKSGTHGVQIQIERDVLVKSGDSDRGRDGMPGRRSGHLGGVNGLDRCHRSRRWRNGDDTCPTARQAENGKAQKERAKKYIFHNSNDLSVQSYVFFRI